MNESSVFILNNPQFEANIFYLPPEDGGRSTGVSSGYRGQFYYDGKNWDASQQFIDKDVCEPGDSVDVLIQTASPAHHEGRMFVNKYFEIREGAKVVGIGKITKIRVKEFQKTGLNQYEDKICKLILRHNKFGIVCVNDLDTVKSVLFRQEDYQTNLNLIKSRKWYLIKDDETKDKKQDFYENLLVLTFSDQQGQEYAAIIYDNEELWKDPEIVEILPLP
jgi:hypothetical protein